MLKSFFNISKFETHPLSLKSNLNGLSCPCRVTKLYLAANGGGGGWPGPGDFCNDVTQK